MSAIRYGPNGPGRNARPEDANTAAIALPNPLLNVNIMEEITTFQWLTGNDGLTAPPLVRYSSDSRPLTDSPRTDTAPTAVPRILLAEDNADARAYLQRLLEAHYEVTAVADGQAALDAFYQRPPDLVLSDIAMPRLDGMQLLQILKAQHHTARVPVMLMSGEAGEGIRIDAYQAGADDYLIKPFSARELLVRVQAQLLLAPSQPGIEWQFISLFPQAPVAILRGPQFVVELATPAMCEIWNRSLRQLLGRPIFAVLTEAAGQGFEELLTGVLQTGIPFEGRELPVMLIRDGKPQPVLVSFVYKPLYDQPNGPVSGIVVVATDVTESVRVRRVVEDSNNRLQTLFEQAPVGVAILGLGPASTFELANPFYCELVGRTADQLIGKPLMDALPELAGQGFYDLLMQVMATGTPYSSRETAARLVRNGQLETVYVDFVYQPHYGLDQTIIGVAIIVTDITQAVRARQRVETNERLLNAMVRQTPLGVGIFRGPEFIIELVNPTLYQLWGGTHKQVIEKPLFEALPGVTVAGQELEKKLAGVYETGIRFEVNELPIAVKRNGRLKTSYFNFAYEPLRNQDGNIERIMVVASDVTAARQARLIVEESEARYRQLAAELEERVKQRTQELERSNLDLMQFASVASHDLKEPLRKVQIFGTRLEGMLAGRLNEEEADLFRRLVSATARMQTLVGDVLRLSILSDQTVGFEPVVLNTTMDRIRDDLELVIHQRGAELTTESLPTVLAAEGQMHQLFQNLISNALKFNNNPVPTVRVEPVPLTDTVVDELRLPTRDYAVIAVTDNGIGFESKYKDKIFDMFQRLNGRSQYAGTGIGLTIVRKIIENHRGFIDVRSEPGRGTVFRVALPFR